MTAVDTTSGDVNATPPHVWPKPPIVTVAFAVLGALGERYLPMNPDAFSFKTETVAMGAALALCGLAIGAVTVRQFMQAKTTIVPGEASTALMTTGVFNKSRNPIYLAFVLLVLGLGVAASSPWLVVAGGLLGIYLQERVIKREEAYLLARFGGDYTAYRKRVRRWF